MYRLLISLLYINTPNFTYNQTFETHRGEMNAVSFGHTKRGSSLSLPLMENLTQWDWIYLQISHLLVNQHSKCENNST